MKKKKPPEVEVSDEIIPGGVPRKFDRRKNQRPVKSNGRVFVVALEGSVRDESDYMHVFLRTCQC